MKLRRNQPCPIHRSLFCCGREQMRKPIRLQLGVCRVEDPHRPRGYRELRSPAEMRKLLNRKIIEQDRKCAICHEEFTDYNDIVPDHRLCVLKLAAFCVVSRFVAEEAKQRLGNGGARSEGHITITAS